MVISNHPTTGTWVARIKEFGLTAYGNTLFEAMEKLGKMLQGWSAAHKDVMTEEQFKDLVLNRAGVTWEDWPK